MSYKVVESAFAQQRGQHKQYCEINLIFSDENNVPFFFNQWGGTNKKQAGRLLLDQTWDAMPNVPVLV